MKKTSLPFVSIVTPVYNGEKYLAECIESVLDQKYTNWEYIIFNNCSTDDTLKIAKQYAEQDDRIKVLNSDTFLKQIPNWNESMRKISPDSKYCKVVHADDCILPECLEKMVTRAEEYPTAGVISSYRFIGTKIYGLHGKGLSYKTNFLPGKEAGKMVLENRNYLFGSPTTLLYRSEMVRAKEKFYNPSVVHADAYNCFELLAESDFAFVHQPLSFTRMHNESTTTFCDYYNTSVLHDINAIKTFGDYYLTTDEINNILSETIKKEHWWLARSLFKGRGWDVVKYHKKELTKMNLSLNRFKIVIYFFIEVAKGKLLIQWIKRKMHNSAKITENIKNTIEKKQNDIALNKS